MCETVSCGHLAVSYELCIFVEAIILVRVVRSSADPREDAFLRELFQGFRRLGSSDTRLLHKCLLRNAARVARNLHGGLLGLVETLKCRRVGGDDSCAVCCDVSPVVYLRPGAFEANDGGVAVLAIAECHASDVARPLDARYAGAVLLDHTRAEERLRDVRVALLEAAVCPCQMVSGAPPSGKRPGLIPLDEVHVDVDLDCGVRGVVAMGQRVGDGLAHGLPGNLGDLAALYTGLAEHEPAPDVGHGEELCPLERLDQRQAFLLEVWVGSR